MTLQGLKSNIERQKEIAQEIFLLYQKLNTPGIDIKTKDALEKSINSLINQFKILNKATPDILNNISIFRELPTNNKQEGKTDLLKLSYSSQDKKVNVTINKQDKERFLTELRINQEFIDRLRKKGALFQDDVSFYEFKQPSWYKKTSNKFFSDYSTELLKKGEFKELINNLRKASIPLLSNSYLSMAFFTTVIAFILGLLCVVASLLFYPSIILKIIYFPILFPILTLFAFYTYPSTESQGIGSKIRQEVPFVTLHMAAISGAKIEPSQIFKIIAFGREYHYTRREMIKIINQTNVYGYDLVTALKNVARTTPSKELGELLNGLATTISGGGDLTEFLNKRAETLFFEYKMDREKYTKEAETFMDIYISLVIAAPMVLSLLMVLMNMGVMNIGISLEILTFAMVAGIALINIVFIAFLNMRQPTY